MPPTEPDIAPVAALLGEPARAAMCLALMDDRARPASELARAAAVSAPAASSHLAKLTAAGILRVERQGRWRYYRLAGPEVAHAVEALAVIAPPGGGPAMWAGGRDPARSELRAARTCYRHLAGVLGVALADALVREGWLAEEDGGYGVTPGGAAHFGEQGVAACGPRGAGATARRCLDWTERRPHVVGPLGVALAELAFARGWVRRQRGTRAVLLTPFGRSELRRVFRVRL